MIRRDDDQLLTVYKKYDIPTQTDSRSGQYTTHQTVVLEARYETDTETYNSKQMMSLKSESQEVLTGAGQGCGDRGAAGNGSLLPGHLAQNVPDGGKWDTQLRVRVPAVPDEILE